MEHGLTPKLSRQGAAHLLEGKVEAVRQALILYPPRCRPHPAEA